MRQSTPVPITFVLLLLGGLGLIASGFWLVVPEDGWSRETWLYFGVVCLVYLVNSSKFLMLFGMRLSNFSSNIPGMAILSASNVGYSALAFAGVFAGLVFGIPFRFQIWYQLVALFPLLFVVGVASRASRHAEAVSQEQKSSGMSLQVLRDTTSSCDALFTRLGPAWQSEIARFRQVQSTIRFLSPCDVPKAAELELDITCALQEMSSAAAGASQFAAPPPEVGATLDRISAMLVQRRQLRIE